MNERDIEFVKQAWTENDWDGHVDIPKLIDIIRADEREAIAAWLDGEAGSGRIISCTRAAKAIRARGQE